MGKRLQFSILSKEKEILAVLHANKNIMCMLSVYVCVQLGCSDRETQEEKTKIQNSNRQGVKMCTTSVHAPTQVRLC